MIIHDPLIEKFFPGLVIIEEHNGDIQYRFADDKICEEIGRGVKKIAFTNRQVVYYDEFTSIILECKDNFYLALSIHENRLDLCDGVLRIPSNLLSEESCVKLFSMGIDIFYQVGNSINDYKKYNEKEIMRKHIINTIINE